MNSELKPIIGIVGGMGPKAGLELGSRIIEETIASQDQDHLPFVLFSVPQVADRSSFLIGENHDNPADSILDQIKKMSTLGITDVAIACNTCHAPQIIKKIEEGISLLGAKIKMHHVVTATIDVLKLIPNINRVGILSTVGCHRSQIYEKALSQGSIPFVPLHDNTVFNLVHESIYNKEWGIKASSHKISSKVVESLNQVITSLKKEAVSHVILGCSELPLALSYLDNKDIQFLDPMRCLARSLVDSCAPHKLKPLIFDSKNAENKLNVSDTGNFLVEIPKRKTFLATDIAEPQEYVTPDAPRPMQ